MAENLEEKLEEELEGTSDQAPKEQSEEETPEETSEELSPEEEAPGEEAEEVAPQEIEIEGRKYTVDELKELIQKARNYDHLLPDYTRKSQRLAELEKKLAESASPEDRAKAEALKYLRENLGIVTREELQNLLADFAQRLEDMLAQKEKLNRVIDYLSKKYDGTTFPKFDYEKLREYLYRKYGEDKSAWPPEIDLEYEYWQMHRDFFERLPETIKKRAVPTESKGVPTSIIPPAKKIVEKPTKEGEISLEEAMLKALGETSE